MKLTKKKTTKHDREGRPWKFKNVKIMQEAIDAYFAEREEKQEPLTITGLAMALDTTRDVLIDYQHRDEFTNAIKKAKQKCENYAEQKLFVGNNQTGAIFALKNYKWTDKQEIEFNEKRLIEDDE